MYILRSRQSPASAARRLRQSALTYAPTLRRCSRPFPPRRFPLDVELRAPRQHHHAIADRAVCRNEPPTILHARGAPASGGDMTRDPIVEEVRAARDAI